MKEAQYVTYFSLYISERRRLEKEEDREGVRRKGEQLVMPTDGKRGRLHVVFFFFFRSRQNVTIYNYRRL